MLCLRERGYRIADIWSIGIPITQIKKSSCAGFRIRDYGLRIRQGWRYGITMVEPDEIVAILAYSQPPACFFAKLRALKSPIPTQQKASPIAPDRVQGMSVSQILLRIDQLRRWCRQLISLPWL